MPSVNLAPETYEALKRIAARKGCSVDELAQGAVERHLAEQAAADDAERVAELKALLEQIWARIPKDVSADEIEADVEAAVKEARAARRARSR